ncbi:MAG: signal peptidase I [Anaerolineales bacterium]|nr:signal peptidase I [Anaerolineales bacterium]
MEIDDLEHHEGAKVSEVDSLDHLAEVKKGSRGKSILRVFTELLEIAIIAGALFLAVNMVTARVRVESISMEPSLYEGEFVVVNKLAYRWAEPQRGDIIVFRYPGNPSKRFIKRIIGLEGDIISVQDEKVYVNGTIIEEPYIKAAPRYEGEWVVGHGKVFVLGDNRNNSNDSKNWEPLSMDSVIGKAIFVYWPPNKINIIPHYDLMATESS